MLKGRSGPYAGQERDGRSKGTDDALCQGHRAPPGKDEANERWPSDRHQRDHRIRRTRTARGAHIAVTLADDCAWQGHRADVRSYGAVHIGQRHALLHYLRKKRMKGRGFAEAIPLGEGLRKQVFSPARRAEVPSHCACSLSPASAKASLSSLASWHFWLHLEGHVQYTGTFSCIHAPRVPRAVNCSLLAFCTKFNISTLFT